MACDAEPNWPTLCESSDCDDVSKLVASCEFDWSEDSADCNAERAVAFRNWFSEKLTKVTFWTRAGLTSTPDTPCTLAVSAEMSEFAVARAPLAAWREELTLAPPLLTVFPTEPMVACHWTSEAMSGNSAASTPSWVWTAESDETNALPSAWVVAEPELKPEE